MSVVVRTLIALLVLVGALTVDEAGASARPAAGPSKIGNDISWPQCGRAYPTGQAFGIVGLNGGLANNKNKCFDSQWQWALGSSGNTTQPKAALYVNTANPYGAGPVWWPNGNSFYSSPDGSDSNTANGTVAVSVPVPTEYGTCTADPVENLACSYVYGWAKAYEDDQHFGPGLRGYQWWLDVETTNSWETPSSATPRAYEANAATLRGMINYLQGVNIEVGVYSTAYQWRQITGDRAQSDVFSTVLSWVAGASSSNAASFCSDPAKALIAGSKVTLVQYVSGRLDYDVACA